MLTEGKIKSNIKSPPLECNDCNYYGGGDDFKFGILWWANEHCPKCGSKNLSYGKKRGSPPPPAKPKRKKL